MKIDRQHYADHYGPTTGDRVRLADTDLLIRIERDHTVYGEEAMFGGGKVIRDGMGQSPLVTRAQGAPDLVITSVIVIDANGIYKADVGIRDGRIWAIGKAGNADIQDGVTPGLEIGAATEILSGEGRILTAGGIDTHVHFISPNQIPDAFHSGITTLIGGGTGPATGTNATTCTPGAWNLRRMYEAVEGFPLNFGFLGKGNSSSLAPLREQVQAGAIGLKLHEDWGTTPAAIDCCLTVADEFDVQVAIHTDTLNEAGFVEDTIAAIAGRTIHTYHTEGAGGGHAPDIIRVCGEANVLPSSTNPTRPFTVNTIDEHLDMLMVCHHLDAAIAEGPGSITPSAKSNVAWFPPRYEKHSCMYAVAGSANCSTIINGGERFVRGVWSDPGSTLRQRHQSPTMLFGCRSCRTELFFRFCGLCRL